MGWSELTARPQVDIIFKGLKLKYSLKRVFQPDPVIQIHHEGELEIPDIKRILKWFPDFVYVDFIPNTPFPAGDAGDSFDYDKSSTDASFH